MHRGREKKIQHPEWAICYQLTVFATLNLTYFTYFDVNSLEDFNPLIRWFLGRSHPAPDPTTEERIPEVITENNC